MKKKTTNFADFIRQKLKDDPSLAQRVEEERFNSDLAQQIYDARKSRGWSQAELARKIDTSQSVISRIEDSDYSGHSLNLLKKIAHALGMSLRVEFFEKPVFKDDMEGYTKSIKTKVKDKSYESWVDYSEFHFTVES